MEIARRLAEIATNAGSHTTTVSEPARAVVGEEFHVRRIGSRRKVFATSQ